jgi:sugar phosphate isomerase/epimerase
MENLTRRKFLEQASAGAALVASASFLKASSAKRALGIQLYTVLADMKRDAPGTLRALGKIGYRYVEAYDLGGQTPQQFRRALDNAGLKCPSTHGNYAGDDPTPQFDAALAIGARYAVSSMLMTSVAADGPDHYGAHSDLTEDDFKRMAALANAIGAKAKKAGIQYVYHNHNFEFIKFADGRTGYQVVLDETDPELVKLELDCGWMAVAGVSPADYLRTYHGRYRMIHVKDFLPVNGPTTALFGPGRPSGTELGRGYIDYKPIFAAAEVSGVEYYLSEQEPPFVDMTPLEAARVNYEYILSI